MINTDVHPIDQPQGTFRYALNAVNQTAAGDFLRRSTEQGTELCAELPAGYSLVGSVYIGGNRHVLFSTNGISSEIGTLRDCVYTTLTNQACLNFSTDYPIFATYRLRQGCEDTVYFTDYLNPVRVINLTQNNFDCEQTELFRSFMLPNLTMTVSAFGGNLAPGSYSVVIRYLDEDENATPWLAFAGPVAVYTPGSPYQIAVGNFSPSTDPINGTLTTNSIEVSVDNMDTDFTYYQLGLIPYTTGAGTGTLVYVTESISTAINSFVFRSTEALAVTEPIEEVIIDPVAINRAKYITQIENKLILANVAERTEQWCEWQRYANAIQSKYVVQQNQTKDAAVSGDPKHPNYYEWLGYMGDEVYAFGIVYVFSDGRTSPVFHIPGRVADGFDTQLLTVTSAFPSLTEVLLDDVRHLGLSLGQTVPRWKVENTARTDTRLMSYWESESGTYPTTEDCEGGYVYGDLAGRKIRHHRFPCRTKEQHISERQIRRLGIEFENIIYPSADVVGHYFVRAKRDESNKTVLDSAYFFESWHEPVTGNVVFGEFKASPLYLTTSPVIGLEPKTTAAVSPRFSIKNEIPNMSYIKHNYVVNRIGQQAAKEYRIDDNDLGEADLTLSLFMFRFDQTRTLGTKKNTAVEYKVGVEPMMQEITPFYTVDNQSFTHPMLFIKGLSDIISPNNGLHYGYYKVLADVYRDLNALEYVPVSKVINTTDTQVCFMGDTFISEIAYHNVINEEVDAEVEGSDPVKVIQIDGSILSSLFFETDINPSLRVQGATRCEKFFSPSVLHLALPASIENQLLEGFEFMKDYLTVLDTDNTVYAEPCKYQPQVNDDYHVKDRFKVNYPLGNIDCCSQCLGVYPNRVVYSEQSFQEELTDNFRTFLANNYRDIEGETGEITQVVRYEEKLYIFTKENVWYLPPSMQERVNEEGFVSYVGSGSFFEIPPRRFNESAVAGCSDPRSVIKTPYGVFFYDSVSKVPYLIQQGITPINKGISKFLKESVNNLLETYYPGNAVEVGYDEEYNRLLLTIDRVTVSPDKEFYGETVGKINTSALYGKLVFDSATTEWYTVRPTLGVKTIAFNDDEWFCNKSFTLSYSFDEQGWVSFHSYLSDQYLTGKNEIFSVKGNKIWQHNKGNFLRFYGSYYPFIVEPVEQSAETKIWDYFDFYTEAELDGVERNWVTFDQALLYNSFQSTGLRNMQPRIISPTYMQDRVRELDYIDLDRQAHNWRGNSLRSMVATETNLFLPSCDLTMEDKTFNDTALNQENWWEMEPLKSKYLVIRFIFRIFNNTKLTYFFKRDTGYTHET